MSLLDGPFDDRPARYATDEEWEAAVDAANAEEIHAIVARECLGTPELTHGELTARNGTCPVCGGYGYE
jgi:hypothetical protein